MSQFKRGLLLMAIAGVLVLLVYPTPANAAPRTRGTAPGPITPTKANFTSSDLEYYLNDDGIAYVRPGVKFKFVSITGVAAGSKPVVEFYLTDDFGNPLDRNGAVTPGPIAPGFILALWDPTIRYYTTLTMRLRNGVNNPAADQGGTYTDLEVGHYKYTFGTALAAGFDVTKTYTLGVYGRRTLSTIIGKDYYLDNFLYNFRPDGGTKSTLVWGAMSSVTNTCNKCHNPLGLHGGTRRDPALCMLCHNPQIALDASGNTFNGKVFFHKLHRGDLLPSVVAGTPYILANTNFGAITFPQDIRNCTTCHDPAATEKEIWMTRPTRAVCGSCHDDVNFATGVNHPAGAQADDTKCASCHVPDSGKEFDASVKGAHINPLKSSQKMNYSVAIISVSNIGPGKKPTVVFAVKDKNGAKVDGTKLSSFSMKLGGPTSSYTTYFSETVAATATNKTPGTYDATTGYVTYNCQNAIPATEKTTSTWTISADVYNTLLLKRADGKADISIRDAAVNPIKYFALDGSANAAARRTSVVITNCNNCHNDLAMHGDQRKNIDECVLCHNPLEGDQARRPATAGNKESVSFQRMIHRIHTGEEMTQDLTIYGFGGTPNNFNEVTFPGDRRDCVKCHVNIAAVNIPVNVPFGQGLVTTLRDYFSPQTPNAAACLGCHDDSNAAAHAYLNTTTFPGATVPAEACGACHSAGKDWAIEKVHAR